MNSISKQDTKVCAECYYIIKNLNKQYQEKIPLDFINEMYEIMDKSYKVNIKEGVLPDTKVFFALIMRKYFQNDNFNRVYDSYHLLNINTTMDDNSFRQDIFKNENKKLENDEKNEINLLPIKQGLCTSVVYKMKSYNKLLIIKIKNLIKKIFHK